MESVSNKLTEQEVQVFKADVNGLLRRAHTPRSNLSKEERKSLTKLKKDKDRMVLTVDKGVVMVVLDKEKYRQKVENLLGQSAYNTL